MEVAVREHVKSVRLVIVDVGDMGSPAVKDLGLERLPSAWPRIAPKEERGLAGDPEAAGGVNENAPLAGGERGV